VFASEPYPGVYTLAVGSTTTSCCLNRCPAFSSWLSRAAPGRRNLRKLPNGSKALFKRSLSVTYVFVSPTARRVAHVVIRKQRRVIGDVRTFVVQLGDATISHPVLRAVCITSA
jgi:hypothetical protein